MALSFRDAVNGIVPDPHARHWVTGLAQEPPR